MNTAVSVPPSCVDRSFSTIIAPWLVVFSAALFFFFEFLQVNIFNSLNPYLYKAFHLTDTTQLGDMSVYYFYADVLFLIPAGMILDRVSTRKLIITAMSLCVFSTFIFSMTTALWQAELCRFITGFGGAFCLLSCVRLASRWFPAKRMALVIGLVVTFAMIGAMIAQTPFTLMSAHFGWRKTLVGDALLGLFMLMMIVIFVHDYPPGQENKIRSQQQTLKTRGFWRVFFQALSNIQTWLAGIYASLLNLPIFLLGATWGMMYLVQVHHLDREQASFVTSMLYVGMIVGSPALGWLSDRLRKRKLPMILGAIASLLIVIIIMYAPHLLLGDLMFLFFALGFAIAAQIIAYPLVAESNPENLTGTAEGLASVLIMSGGFVIPLFPMLLDLDWRHIMIHGLPHYSLANFHMAMMIMPVAFAIGLLASLLVKETRCQSYSKTHSKQAEMMNALASR